jgi:pyrroline-5-carboxylate reductase
MTSATRRNSVVFLGGGRITGALLAGLRLAGLSLENYDRPIVVHDRNTHKLRQLRTQYGVLVESDLKRAVEQAHILIIAVRPDSVRELLVRIGRLGPIQPTTAVSLAAGTTEKPARMDVASGALGARYA